jgi:16S rRNA (cytosine1402-N4)-methyltransferase
VEPRHTPVLLDRVVALLAPALDRPDAVWVDATVGLGGHAAAVLDRCPRAHLIGVDRDPEALQRAARVLEPWETRTTLVQTRYDQLASVIRGLDHDGVHGVLFDLGVSSMQLDSPERGFAYSRDAPLDMRMDPATPRDAAEIVNTYSVDELTRILRTYGEERFARRIAERIVRERSVAPFTSSSRLVDTIQAAIPAVAQRAGGHPARRSFQALRIEVNSELAILARAIPAAVDLLHIGGRIVVLSYHSLEDRITKRALVAAARSDVPDDLPVVPGGRGPKLRLLTRGAERAGAEEIARNRRASSVRLRAAERIEVAA